MSQFEVAESADNAIFVEVVNDMVAKVEEAKDGKQKIGENIKSGQQAAQAIEDDVIFLSSDSEYDYDSDVVVVAEVVNGCKYRMSDFEDEDEQDVEDEEMDQEMDEEYEEEDEEEDEGRDEDGAESSGETLAKKAKLE